MHPHASDPSDANLTTPGSAAPFKPRRKAKSSCEVEQSSMPIHLVSPSQTVLPHRADSAAAMRGLSSCRANPQREEISRPPSLPARKLHFKHKATPRITNAMRRIPGAICLLPFIALFQGRGIGRTSASLAIVSAPCHRKLLRPTAHLTFNPRGSHNHKHLVYSIHDSGLCIL